MEATKPPIKEREPIREWFIRIKVTKNEENSIKRKILDSEMNIGEYTKKKLLEEK